MEHLAWLLLLIALIPLPILLAHRAGRVATVWGLGVLALLAITGSTGFLIGLGILIVCLLWNHTYTARCPHCAEPIRAEAVVCPHCRFAVSTEPSRAE